MIQAGGMALALGLAAAHFFWTTIKGEENFQEFIIALKAFGRDCQLWRSWLKKPEFLRTLQSLGWWGKQYGRYICIPQSVFLDQLLMFNLQMQFIKLIFFSFLIKSKSTSMDYQFFQRLFRQFMSVDHWDSRKYFRLILGVNSWVMSQGKWQRMMRG